MIDIEKAKEAIKSQAANVSPFGAKLKFVLGDQVVLIDGTGSTNEVIFEDGEADCTISTDVDTFMKLKSGDLNPMMAVMSGKIKISGDIGLAMKLQSLL
ncbi:MAG TPA: SCP2 sterol-binding domain-containing protein [Saprospiraceae bacterium]|nr:SCP2 sterol-binding domain-containing protein [Saprospiraceae bacterium]MCB9327198.1 SCP2 sterol-binding domain-containing protein [Lewinellaceae bacterium]HPK09834.1 SCP2 sterol-binding domain-containing protein [Saprospiraceae bacterium]HPQ20492.1 SCP2 sterol-binding domain-containing protein [Saprospiraceae bacterium]